MIWRPFWNIHFNLIFLVISGILISHFLSVYTVYINEKCRSRFNNELFLNNFLIYHSLLVLEIFEGTKNYLKFELSTAKNQLII